MQLLVPGGSSATNLDVDFTTFTNLMNAAIGLEYVEPFEEVNPPPPGVLDPYTTDNPTNIATSVSGNTLTLAWPAGFLGWILQAQTNDLSSTNWFDLPGTGATNSAVFSVDPVNPAVFYRLRQP